RRAEVDRARPIFTALKAAANLQFIGDGQGRPGSDGAFRGLLRSLGIAPEQPLALGEAPRDQRQNFDPSVRLRRQFDQLVSYTQALIRASGQKRAALWSKTDSSSVRQWEKTTHPMRDYIWDEVIGRLPNPSVPADPRTRLIYDEPKFRGYEVMLDVWPAVFGCGFLLLPMCVRVRERWRVVRY